MEHKICGNGGRKRFEIGGVYGRLVEMKFVNITTNVMVGQVI